MSECCCLCTHTQEYYCAGCYYEYILHRDSDFIHRLCCWGLGFFWEAFPHTPIRNSWKKKQVGVECFLGLCCIRCGNSGSLWYEHEEQNNQSQNVDVITPCGVFKRSKGHSFQNGIEVKTCCCGYRDSFSPPHEKTGAAKVSPSSIPDIG